MGHATTRECRPHLHPGHPSVLGEAGLDDRRPPLILPLGGLGPRHGLHDEIRLTSITLGHAPHVVGGPVDRRRKIGGVAPRRARIDPADDDVDFRITQGNVVLEVLDADGLVQVPGRHHPVDHLFPDPARPTSDLIVGHQRHRPHLTGAVTSLTALLENRSDVPTERDLTRRLGARRSRGGQQQCASQHPWPRRRYRESHHVSCLRTVSYRTVNIPYRTASVPVP